ncbi:hypothetical protein [Ferruginivarius sediminum]|uniref:Site-specific integrase n=1 Tax=Ferruginivarius sediminum TaxID=2661937 RepID=A0A369T4M0_9PROT|nr:hypothetical protein [Ferruginivarius sediminum]RDD60188.1 hypothetical protein DRB17_19390 [Ferruginivarius sediminum]
MQQIQDTTGREVTRTRATEHRYAELARRLVARAARAHDCRADCISLASVIEHVLNDTARASRATLRQYRAALRHAVELGWLAPDEAAWRRIARPPAGHGTKRGALTSAKKSKRITDRDLRQIDTALRQSRSQYAGDLRALLLVNRLIGARIFEWRRARFLKAHPATGGPALVLASGKTSNGRGNGATRTLFLETMSRDEVTAVAHCAGRLAGRHNAGTFERWQVGAAKLLQRVCRRLWPRRKRHITLYTTRHAFAARAKCTHSRQEVAAMMGHAAAATAGRHYARALRGQALRHSRLPRPAAVEVATVRLAGMSRFARAEIHSRGPAR